ncbi:hypothetical protein [Aquimarina megaterium]|uniref:hypothetical protein n=1 Tax=Aquimarina megaterium TaxID=1443666 RepID=UPI00111210A1|nr:hypothetical protein [Aquimarina megaterium]
MNKLSTYCKGFILALVMFTYSCVNDDSFFPDSIDAKITSTTTIVSILNDIKTRNSIVNEEDLCFTFKYPLIFGYNTDSTIRVDDYQGLLGVISGQSANFNITGLQFPVQIMFKGANSTILVENEDALINVLRECEIKTFRDVFNHLYRQCFKFEYPIVLNDKDNKEVDIDTEESFSRFLVDQGANYQPDFKFPISILVTPDLKPTRISTYYEFYEIINNCIGCPAIRFEIQPLQENEYRFIPDIEIMEGYQLFFKINGEVITDQVIDGNPFTRQFTPGTYETCIKVITTNCLKGTIACKEIVVEPICPVVTFTNERVTGTNTYKFNPSVTGVSNDVTIGWYVNEVFIENSLLSAGIVELDLDQGTNNVCAKVITPNCPNGQKFCDEVVVP